MLWDRMDYLEARNTQRRQGQTHLVSIYLHELVDLEPETWNHLVGQECSYQPRMGLELGSVH
jgi:hypothetical protein